MNKYHNMLHTNIFNNNFTLFCIYLDHNIFKQNILCRNNKIQKLKAYG